ncbi:MAG TPA: hypothetical protein VHX52_13170 [Steroidobacteraceae bacterium]|jgi:hypothetical protein|nr:hypothetical protein [Steroidobacteraceae bacterium]
MSTATKTIDQNAPVSQEGSQVPAGIYQKHGSYYVVRKNKWIRICRVDEGEIALHEKLFELNYSGTDAATPVDTGTVPHAILSYLKDGMGQLSEATRKTCRATGMRDAAPLGQIPPGGDPGDPCSAIPEVVPK